MIVAHNTNQKPGYKQTEVGLIPEGWMVKKLFMVAQFTNGKAHEQFIDDNGEYIVVNSKFVSTEGEVAKHSKENLSPLFSDDIVMVMSDVPNGKALAKCFFVGENGKYTLNQRICAFRPYDADSKYLFYKLNRNTYFLSFDSGAGQTNLKRGDVLDCPIALPSSKTEQQAIATALSDVDALITSLDKLIAKKRDIKQATMQQLLTGKTRLPGFSEAWKTIKLEDVADKNVQWSITGGPFGSNLKTDDYVEDGVRIIQLQNIGDGVFHNEYKIYTSDEKADELIGCNIYPGEIILSKMGDPVARACVVPNDERRYLMASDGIRLVVNKKRFDNQFVHDYINSVYFRKKAIEASTGSTRQRIGLEDLKKLPFVAPPLLEQQAIAAVLSDMDAEIVALEQRRDKTRALKQGMMQELLTGKTRLLS